MEHSRLRHFSQENAVYFITSNVQRREEHFRDFACARLLEGTLWKNVALKNFDLFAYVIMPDHLHMMVRVNTVPLSEILRSVKTNASREINRYLCGRGGATPPTNATTPTEQMFQWQEGFHDHMIRDEKDFLYHLEYLKANPVKAGLVEKTEDYPFLFIDENALARVFGY